MGGWTRNAVLGHGQLSPAADKSCPEPQIGDPLGRTAGQAAIFVRAMIAITYEHMTYSFSTIGILITQALPRQLLGVPDDAVYPNSTTTPL